MLVLGGRRVDDLRGGEQAPGLGDRCSRAGIADLRLDNRGVVGQRSEPALQPRARLRGAGIEATIERSPGTGSAGATSRTFASVAALRMRRSGAGEWSASPPWAARITS